MFDIGFDTDVLVSVPKVRRLPPWKRGIDVVSCCCLMLPFAVLCVVLWLLNPFFNIGPLFYRTSRMGAGMLPFEMVKFRTMTGAGSDPRGAYESLDERRITPLGRWLRRARVDELPQLINIWRGEMTLIGPRPDCYHHALAYAREVPGYARRFELVPGITGLAQITVGYAQTVEQVRRKAAADVLYLRKSNFRLDLWIIMRTAGVMLRLRGS